MHVRCGALTWRRAQQGSAGGQQQGGECTGTLPANSLRVRPRYQPTRVLCAVRYCRRPCPELA
eukprot:3028609-Rhodomonas_salina.3